MLTNFFSKTKPSTIIVILLLFLFYYGLALINGFKGTYSFEVVPLFLLLLALTSFIHLKNNLSFENSYILFFFTILIGLFPTTFNIGLPFYSNITLLLFLRKVYSLQSNKQIFKKLFDAGLWLGVTFILEPFCILFFFILYVSIFIHQKLDFKSVIIPLVSFSVPVFLFFTYCFWYENLNTFYNLFSLGSYYDITLYIQKNHLISFFLVSILVLIATFSKTPKALSVLNDFRRSWILILINFISAIFLIILINNKDGSEFIYLFFPTAVIIANGIELFEKKWFIDIVTILCLVFPLILLFF